MNSKIRIILALCLFLTGCAASDQKASVEKPNISPSYTATTEIVVNQVITKPAASSLTVKTETIRDAVIISDNANLRET